MAEVLDYTVVVRNISGWDGTGVGHTF
jgi:hypothetical protein